MSKRYDAIVIGAGIIGAATALELAKRGWRTLSLDKLPAAGSELDIEHQTAGVFAITYTATTGEMVSQYVAVADNGNVIDAGNGDSGLNIAGNAFNLPADQLATAMEVVKRADELLGEY